MGERGSHVSYASVTRQLGRLPAQVGRWRCSLRRRGKAGRAGQTRRRTHPWRTGAAPEPAGRILRWLSALAARQAQASAWDQAARPAARLHSALRQLTGAGRAAAPRDLGLETIRWEGVGTSSGEGASPAPRPAESLHRGAVRRPCLGSNPRKRHTTPLPSSTDIRCPTGRSGSARPRKYRDHIFSRGRDGLARLHMPDHSQGEQTAPRRAHDHRSPTDNPHPERRIRRLQSARRHP